MNQPFDSLPLELDEPVLFMEQNGTFHRSFDYSFAASDRAAYIHVRPLFRRARWRRFPFIEIRRAALEPIVFRPLHLVVAAAAPLLCAFATIRTGSPLLVALTIAGAAYVSYLFIKSIRGRARLVFELQNANVEFRTPTDGYSEEKIYDLELLQRFVRVIASHGVQVSAQPLN